MFTLPALLYLKVLPLFGKCLYHFIVPNKFRPPHAGGAALSPLVLYRPCTLLGWAGTLWAFLHHTFNGFKPVGWAGSNGLFCTTLAGGRLAPTSDLT
ncbi:hypothetical protein AVEN_232767-1 [Araneus ventricosus]|uniref:Uncharacterized protein n=1 Tax=Araneus ventricosus TaxID=182803 RepID=A0A4Y2KG28_ARAVE|nr:hypothetical protein AVEN_232767-1 [Araneus ventricosus]